MNRSGRPVTDDAPTVAAALRGQNVVDGRQVVARGGEANVQHVMPLFDVVETALENELSGVDQKHVRLDEVFRSITREALS